MARRKKTTHKRHSRRRRVSGIKDIDAMGIGLALAGGVAARVITNTLAKQTNTTMIKLAPYSGVIIGVVLPLFMKNPTMRAIGAGMVAGGAISALGQTGLKVITGMDNTIAWASDNLMGYPGYRQLPYRKVAGIGAGATPGRTINTKSNFSGSRLSQMHTIAGVGPGSGAGGGGAMAE